MNQRPDPDEYAAYYEGYVAAVPDGDIVAYLDTQLSSLISLLAALPAEAGDLRYAPGKWSVKEVLAHLADAERVFAYRLLRFARADSTELSGFDENAYVPECGAASRSVASLLDELRAVRGATVALLAGLEPHAWTRSGTANGARFTVRALAWIAAGHVRHHEQILEKRYLATA